jgi:hypothetical protein
VLWSLTPERKDHHKYPVKSPNNNISVHLSKCVADKSLTYGYVQNFSENMLKIITYGMQLSLFNLLVKTLIKKKIHLCVFRKMILILYLKQAGILYQSLGLDSKKKKIIIHTLHL